MIGKKISHYKIVDKLGEPDYSRFYRDSAGRGGLVLRPVLRSFSEGESHFGYLFFGETL